MVDPESAFGTDIDPYNLNADFRHGCTSAERHFTLVRIFSPGSALGQQGSGLGQSYSVALYADNGDGTTTRVASAWSETVIAGETNNTQPFMVGKVRAGISAGNDLENLCQ